MKYFFIIVLFLSLEASAQSTEQAVTNSLKEFHAALVYKNTAAVNELTDNGLSFGHSNGWIETKKEMIKNLETGYIKYHGYKEDSLIITISDKMASARFVADINVTLNNNTANYHLKVLEVWVKKGKRWLLFARQAVK